MQAIYRLKKNASFQYIYRNGTEVSGELMTMLFVKARGVKLGVSVSKKVGKSVKRSLVKRRINNAFSCFIPHLKGEYNYVLVAREGIADRDFWEIKSAVEALLKRAGHLSEGKV